MTIEEAKMTLLISNQAMLEVLMSQIAKIRSELEKRELAELLVEIKDKIEASIERKNEELEEVHE